MAALSAVVSGNTAWQKVQKGLSSASPAAQEAFRSLKIYLANQALNPQLNVAFFSQADTSASTTGTLLGTGTPKLYASYVKKGTTATLTFFKIADDVTGTNAPSTWKIGMNLTGAGDESYYTNYNPTAYVSGIAVVCHTTFTGATIATGATTACDGFVIYSV
jgi:hypothetical protein